MSEEKTVPSMQSVGTILKQREAFEEWLRKIGAHPQSLEDAASLLMDIPEIKFNMGTAKNSISRLRRYKFVKIKDDIVRLTDESRDFLKGLISYSDYILSCLSTDLEWTYFFEDIYDIVEKNKKIKTTQILKILHHEMDYKEKEWDSSYLSKIWPVLEAAEVIEKKGQFIVSGVKSKKEVKKYTSTIQTITLNLLQKAIRRKGIRGSTIRKIYHGAVKARLPLRKYKGAVNKTQELIDQIKDKKIKTEKIMKEEFKSHWELKDKLWDWQESFVKKWMRQRKGIVKVVTGAGKTHMAMSVMENMNKEYENLHVTIVVPTIVLLHQWRENLIKKLQISPNDIGLKGGGHSDTFERKRVLIIVINSAIKDEFIEKVTKDTSNNLLIVDECHRSGAKEFRNIYKSHRNWELGLSATPEREMDTAFDDILVKELGPIIGEYVYNDALENGLIPHFNIYNYAVLLNKTEKMKYDKLTKDIQKIVKRLKYRYPQLESGRVKMEVALKTLQKRHPNDKDIFLYFQKTKERKNDILYPAANRKNIVKDIINWVLGQNTENHYEDPDSPIAKVRKKDRVIVFHEKIDEINSLYMELDSSEVSIYHSMFPKSLNRIGLDLYQSGQTKVLLSVKALIEGVDVPKTNIGIIMASSSSQTQRIQSLGRVLRKAEGKEETNLFIVYVKNTTDERIYRKTNWDEIMGKGNIEFRMYSEFGETQISPPAQRKKREFVDLDFIDENMLRVGERYPGAYKGKSYSFDSYGKMFKKDRGLREYIEEDVSKVWKIFRKYKPGGGKFIVNGLGHILIKQKINGKLETIYICNLKKFVPNWETYIPLDED